MAASSICALILTTSASVQSGCLAKRSAKHPARRSGAYAALACPVRRKAARHARGLELVGCDAATLAYVQAPKGCGMSSAECRTTLAAVRASHEPGCKVLMGHRIASLVVPARVISPPNWLNMTGWVFSP